MIKDKYTIRKKVSLDLARQIFTDLGITYLTHWTKQELSKYANEPVIIPIGDHRFLIGRYVVSGIHKECWRVQDLNEQIVHDFISKSSAVMYCYFMVKNQIHRAHELLEIDAKIGRIDSDLIFWKHHLAIALERNNLVKYNVLYNRISNARLQRTELLNIFKKTLISAKYLNFRNNNYEIK